MLFLNLFLKLYETIQNRFGSWGAPRDIDIDREYGIDSLYCRIIVIEATRTGADAESDDPFRLAHLIVYPSQDGGDLVADRSHDQ